MAIKKVVPLGKKVDKTILGALAVAQRFPGLRLIFRRLSSAFTSGRLAKFSDIPKVKGFVPAAEKLTKTEAHWYTRVLVPIGFPKLETISKTLKTSTKTTRSTMALVQASPDVAKKVVNIKRLENNIQQHISFLQEESFFQKAHKTAKKSGIIERSELSRMWYHDYALEQGLDYRSLQMLRSGGRRISDMRLGRMYFFRYNPDKSYDHIYDSFPLIFMLYEDPDNFSGINFHYLSPKLRAILLGNMLSYLSDQDFSNRTRLFARKFRQLIQSNKRFRHAKAVYRQYKPEHIKSKIIQVHPLDWELAIMVPTERFKTPAGGRVASKKIWRETALRSRTV